MSCFAQLSYLILTNTLDRYQTTSRFGSTKHNLTVSAFSYYFSDYKIINSYLRFAKFFDSFFIL